MQVSNSISVRQLRYFAAVAECRSFTAAARLLNVSQPALGLQVKQLEERLEISLFTRHARGVLLTAAGEVFLTHAQEALKALSIAEQSVARLAAEECVEIALGVTPTTGRVLVADLFQSANAHTAKIKLTLHEAQSDELLRLFRAGALQAAFCYDPPPDDDQLLSMPLYCEDLVIVGRPDIVRARSKPVPISDLHRFALILGSSQTASRRFIEGAARRSGASLTVQAEMAPTALKRELLIRRGYCTIVPLGLFLQDIQSGRLGAAGIRPALTRTMALIVRSDIPQGTRSALQSWARASVTARMAERELGWRPLGGRTRRHVQRRAKASAPRLPV
jgi:LysR family nitrogen assimilation transcriptional regulator